MPIYDYECCQCGQVHEVITGPNDTANRVCPVCEIGMTHRIISASGHYLGNQDATWLKSVGEVVDKDSPAGREFLKNPTRENRRRWMQANGLREYEPGERTKPVPTNMDSPKVTAQLARLAQKRRAISINSR